MLIHINIRYFEILRESTLLSTSLLIMMILEVRMNF
jgi:hypothetical protein